MKRSSLLIIAACSLIFMFSSCSFTLNGASTVGLKTIYVGYIENNAPLVNPTLAQNFTEALKARIRSTTNLSIVQTQEADAVITGTITGYSQAPVSIQATNNNTAHIAGASALTVTVQIKYVNNVDKKLSFEQSFSEQQNFTGDLASSEGKIVPVITTSLIDDIYNKAFANW